MICPKCKAQIPDDARNCPRCNTEMKFDAPLDFSARNEKTIEHKEKKYSQSDSSKNVMFIMFVILLLAVTLLVYYIFSDNSAPDAGAFAIPFVKWVVNM